MIDEQSSASGHDYASNRSAIRAGESTQCSPNLMMLGREVELPIDLMFGTPPFPKGEIEVFDTTLLNQNYG